jgi:hypothetical protein
MQVLPSELKSLITELLVSSPNSLAALARTHSAYQREAERVLYEFIFIDNSFREDSRCMETLATNSEKAALVRFFTFEYCCIPINKMQRVSTHDVTHLLKSLINMHALSDLRVRTVGGSRFGDSEVEAQIYKGLDKILWSVCKF